MLLELSSHGCSSSNLCCRALAVVHEHEIAQPCTVDEPSARPDGREVQRRARGRSRGRARALCSSSLRGFSSCWAADRPRRQEHQRSSHLDCNTIKEETCTEESGGSSDEAHGSSRLRLRDSCSAAASFQPKHTQRSLALLWPAWRVCPADLTSGTSG